MLNAGTDRVALVIGVSDYAHISKLRNTGNDARLIAQTLTDIGFDVTTLMDAPRAEILTTMADFAFRSETADLALVYYAGHGVSVEGRNFLIPADANITSNSDLPDNAIELTQILETVDRARKMRIVILDACRNDPFEGTLEEPSNGPRQISVTTDATAPAEQTRGLRAGMAVPSPERGTLVAYAARDGAVALDGSGDNSPFATALSKKLTEPGLEISLLFRQVRDEVMQMTQNKQEPNTYGALPGIPFYLAGSPEQLAELNAPNRAEAWSRIRPDQEAQIAALAEGGDPRAMLGLAYIRLYPDSPTYDPVEAARLLEKASTTQSPEAEFELARLYEKGLGVPADPAKALELFKSAAAQDFPDAVNELGYLHFTGALGLPIDQAEALRLFTHAADLSQPEAMFNVASFIDDGHIPDAGPQQAASYLYRALRAGSQNVLDALSAQSDSFKKETRVALQAQLKQNGFYDGSLDGSFGKGTIRSIRAAYGLLEEKN